MWSKCFFGFTQEVFPKWVVLWVYFFHMPGFLVILYGLLFPGLGSARPFDVGYPDGSATVDPNIAVFNMTEPAEAVHS